MQTINNPQPPVSSPPPGVTIPPLPTQPPPSLDQQLAHAALQMRVAEFAQRDRHNRETAERHVQWLEATNKLAAAHDRAAAAMERTLDDGVPTDQPMVDAIDRLIGAINAHGTPGGAPPPAPPQPPEWLPDLRAALQGLLAVLNRVQ